MIYPTVSWLQRGQWIYCLTGACRLPNHYLFRVIFKIPFAMEQHSSGMLKLQNTLILTLTRKIPGADLSTAQPVCRSVLLCKTGGLSVWYTKVYTCECRSSQNRGRPYEKLHVVHLWLLKVKIIIVYSYKMYLLWSSVLYYEEELTLKVIWGLTQGFQCYGTGSLLIFPW